jgi:hypothetical protein
MTTYPNSPRLLKGGIVLIDPDSSAVLNVITLQYNPDTLSRSFQVQAIESSEGNRSDALRLTAPPIESIKLEAEIDATDQLEFPEQHPDTVSFGIHPQLAALEMLIYPTSSQLRENNSLANSGTLEIIPMETPLSLFVWSPSRIVPVRLTELSVTEEAFDPSLNPIRAKVSLGLRVLSVHDLGFDHKGGNIYMAYQELKERMAAKVTNGGLSALGIGGIP